MRFKVNKNGIIVDTHTNLLWFNKEAGKIRTFYEAQEYCWSLDVGGFDDWRLPTLKEFLIWEEYADPETELPHWNPLLPMGFHEDDTLEGYWLAEDDKFFPGEISSNEARWIDVYCGKIHWSRKRNHFFIFPVCSLVKEGE